MPDYQKQNKLLSGTDGSVYVNGELLTDLASFEAKVTGTFEEASFVGDYGTYNRYMGFAIDGTITLNKTMSRGARLIGNGFKTGIMPDIKVIASIKNPATGASERIELLGLTFSEFGLNFENKKLLTEALPFKAVDYNYIDQI
ncbi:phage tail tube protein [Paenibacillus sp. MAH-36]|uniref:Phage tail tube protein n=1 Tax=Paenibacillus violae TaxID=3077234 RepID=A0ABU3R7B8_9BACL|nr:phage tail tube protein [Paenibacillus sp. PFR10]MDU0200164.1 phage tail tube protein [Paenibacillus sp. PFR10]